MKIFPKKGIDKLIFGMKQKDVLAIYGMPDKKFDDEDGNKIYIYNKSKLQLNFYEEEDFKLGFIICANENLELLQNKIIGQEFETLKKELSIIKKWEKEDFDLAENYFNEDNWMIFVSEFNKIVKVELGCMIVNDEFDWKF